MCSQLVPFPAARDRMAEVQRRFLASAPSLYHGKVKVWCPAHRKGALSRVGRREESVSQSEISAKSQPWRGEQFSAGNTAARRSKRAAGSPKSRPSKAAATARGVMSWSLRAAEANGWSGTPGACNTQSCIRAERRGAAAAASSQPRQRSRCVP